MEQEVLTRIWQKLGSFRGAARLETWVWRFCALELAAAVRRGAGRREAPTDPAGLHAAEAEGAVPPRGEPLAPADGDDPWLRERIARALERLPDEERDVVELKHFEDLSFTGIAERNRCSPNTAKTRYYRALGRLRRLLAEEDVR